MAYVTPSTVASGDVATAAAWNVLTNDVIAIYDSIKRLSYVTAVADYTVNQTALASASNVFATSATWTADGTSAYRIQFFCPLVNIASTNNAGININLVNAAGTSIVQLATVGRPGNGELIQSFVNADYYYTPSAGATTINVRATYFTATGSTLISTIAPMFLKVSGADLT